MARTSPAQFIRQVRQEAAKVAWPTRKDTSVATLMVLAMAAVMSVFFLLVDQVISWGIGAILG